MLTSKHVMAFMYIQEGGKREARRKGGGGGFWGGCTGSSRRTLIAVGVLGFSKKLLSRYRTGEPYLAGLSSS